MITNKKILITATFGLTPDDFVSGLKTQPSPKERGYVANLTFLKHQLNTSTNENIGDACVGLPVRARGVARAWN